MNISIGDIESLPEVAKKIKDHLAHKVVLFDGEMGAGKTTLIKALCAEMGSDDIVSSPTFSLINHYKTKDDEDIFHFDFYRIEDISEAFDIGFEEYLESGSWCLIEWPEMVQGLLPEHVSTVSIKLAGHIRNIAISNS